MSSLDEITPHRLLAAIVLMGTGLGVGCGGVAASSPDLQTGAGAGGGSGTGGTAGNASAGTAAQIEVPSAGAPAMPAVIDPGPFACPTEQWNCPSASCAWGTSGLILPDSCPCDTSLPRRASDCAAGEALVCSMVTTNALGQQFSSPLALSCHCVPNIEITCRSACGIDIWCSTDQAENTVLCGCAFVLLK